jgi:diguanylate cyclase (GGDEF)-like protein
VACLYIDIDNFKAINTAHTETRVDQTVLPALQHTLERLVRHRGCAYRHGGEEFLILLPNHDRGETHDFAEKVRRTVADTTLTVENTPITVTVSIGIALWPAHGQTFDEVVLAANRAKNVAKAEGRNRVIEAISDSA